MASNRLYLLDGMALIYRAHFALIRSPILTSKGVNTSALFGFANTLIELLQNKAPTHLGVAFDTSAPTQRHEVFPEYKAQREAMPEDIGEAIPNVKRLLAAMHIPVLELDGYEADDIIGTLAARAEAEGSFGEIIMVTPDKDFAQLVTDRVKIYKPGRQGGDAEIIGVERVKEDWCVADPKRVADVLGMWGDASDNIPGVPGIGEKTAKKLIAEFGSLDEILANTAKLKGKQKEKFEEFAEQAKLSRELATIIRDAPVEVSWEDLKICEMDKAAVASLFTEFEFNQLGKRLLGDEFKSGRGAAVVEEQGMLFADLKTLGDVKHDYRIADTPEKRQALAADLRKQKAFCFDVETTGLDERTADLIGISFCWEQGVAHFAPIARGEAAAVLGDFRPALEAEGIEKVGHNLKFDLGVLSWHGIRAAGPFFDTMLAHALIDPDQRHTMDFLSERYLGYTPVPIASLIGERDQEGGQLDMLMVDEKKLAEYAAEDADVTWQLAGKLRPELKQYGQERVFFEIECPLLPVLVAMEREGVAIDTAALDDIRATLEKNIAALESEIYAEAGTKFNLNSPKQLGQILFDIKKLVEKPKKTKTGQYNTSEKVLASLAGEHKLVRDILAYREAAKLKSTYVDALPEFVFSKTGRIHTTFLQLVAATGRLQSNNPNLQNIPVRTEQGREIRKAFVPRGDGWRLLSADYSQIELRVMAAISGDAAMIESFRNGEDIHAATAARVFAVPMDEVTKDMRRTAKTVNFGIIFGITAFGLSQNVGISRSEAKDIIDEYFRTYPGVADYMERIVADAQKQGYVETITGRRRYLRDINSRNFTIRGAAERTAINTPIQGSAADMIKLAMVRIDRALDQAGTKTRMLLQVHDELVFDLWDAEREQVEEIVIREMKEALPLPGGVPIVVDTGVGENWLAAH
ncbi:MAG: DNA polymerase I [Verrucomicrobiales bacterium]